MTGLKNYTLIYSDGACTGNPGPGGWASIVLKPNQEVIELGGRDPSTTNNRMEIIAALKALELVAATPGPVLLYTDSTYLIRGITQWIHGWQRRGWQASNGNEVANQDLWLELHNIVRARGKANPIDWRYVRGHTGVPGNERCDELAVAFSQNRRPELFRGPMQHYFFDLLTLPPKTDLPEMKNDRGEKKKVLSYLSLVGGIPRRHSSWPECERAVKGQAGARFKKAHSPEEEAEILRSWGVDPSRLKTGQ